MTTVIEPFDMTPPSIAPVPDGVHRPLWSVMIPTFNCAKYLRQTLESVLAQDPGPEIMQIEVIDDCSTLDDPEAVVRELGKGRVAFYRKPKNAGAIANFNTCIERSRGQLVHILHGDDWVESGFYLKVRNAFANHSNVDICITRSFVVDENGVLDSLSTRLIQLETPNKEAKSIYYDNPVCTPGVVVRRSAYENNGGFNLSLIHTADWEMWIRVIFSTGGIFINQPLANYRKFPGNDTGRLARTGDNLRDYLRFGQLMKGAVDNFNYEYFERHVMRYAQSQAIKFRKLNDDKAEKANIALYQELLDKQPFMVKAKTMLRGARNMASAFFKNHQKKC